MRTIFYMILANVFLLQVLHFLFGPFVFDNLPNIPGPAWYSHRKWQLYHRQKLQLILKYNKYKQNTLVVLYQNTIERGQRYLMLSQNGPFLKPTLTFFLSQNLNLCMSSIVNKYACQTSWWQTELRYLLSLQNTALLIRRYMKVVTLSFWEMYFCKNNNNTMASFLFHFIIKHI